MSAQLTFGERLRAVLMPTSGQIIGSLVISLVILAILQAGSFVSKLGLPAAFTAATHDQIQQRFNALLTTQLASQLALITFWALIGLVAYLICWGLYNILIEARNEVTLTTAYTNRGHWRGPYETLALKTVAGVGLALVVGSLWYGHIVLVGALKPSL